MTERITPEDIVEVAIRRLAEGGLHALGMRRIATELGVQQSALYWHFDNKQELLAAVADQIVAPIAAPGSNDWSSRVVSLASSLRTELLRYPDGAELVATSFAFRLGARGPFEQFSDELTSGGLGRSDAEVAASVLLHFVLGFVTDEQQHHQATALGAIASVDGNATAASVDDRFARALQLIVAGAEAQLNTSR